MLWVLFAILAVVTQGQPNNCTLKYYTVNTFEDQKSFTFSCYGNGADCDVYYASPGMGCADKGSLTSIGTVPENETQVLTSDDGFKLSGGFCSDNQIGVYHIGTSGEPEVHLPRVPDAGTKFRIPVSNETIPLMHKCSIFALSSPTYVTISVNDGPLTVMTIDPFRSENFNLGLLSAEQADTRIIAEYPVIVSCVERFTVLPISSEPLLMIPHRHDYVSVAITDCNSNALLRNFSKVKVTFAAYKKGAVCEYTRHDSEDIQVLKAGSNGCYFFVEPLDNICVSMFGVGKGIGVPYGVGLPESSFSNRFVTNSKVDIVRLFSFSETICAGYDFVRGEPDVPISLMFQDPSNKVSFPADRQTFKRYTWVDCNDPILFILPLRFGIFPYLSGYQSEEMWQPWIDSEYPIF